MRSHFFALVPLLAVAACSAGGGADAFDTGPTAGAGGRRSAPNDGGADGKEPAELPPPVEEEAEPDETAGAGGSPGSSGTGGSASGGAKTSGGAAGTGGKGGGAGGKSSGAGGKGTGAGGAPGGLDGDCEADDGWPAESRTFECQVLAIVNEKRKAGAVCGGFTMAPTGPVAMESHLRKAARGHALDMAENGYFDHDSLSGKTSFKRMQEAGYPGGALGENIAKGQDTPAAAMVSWMKSSGHCKVLMNPKYKHVGVGFARDASGETHWVQDFGGP